MPNGFPAFPQGRFPDDLPPTWFHPASPRIKPAKPAKDVETSSIATTSTFSSTVGLIKNSVKSKLPISYKEHRTRKEFKAASTDVKEKEVKKEKKPLPDYNARKNTTEAFAYLASTR